MNRPGSILLLVNFAPRSVAAIVQALHLARTFYAASGRGEAPFVTVGTNVGENTTVCIVEARKVFNEISAGVAGGADRKLVRNQQAVELGQPLMLARARA